MNTHLGMYHSDKTTIPSLGNKKKGLKYRYLTGYVSLKPSVVERILHLAQVFHLPYAHIPLLIVAALRKGLQLSSSRLPSLPSFLIYELAEQPMLFKKSCYLTLIMLVLSLSEN